MTASDIEEVIEHLSVIVDETNRSNSRLGYFPALYRKVTLAVRKGIADGFFEDGDRMERLDVVFANRYLEAYDSLKRGAAPTGSWAICFEAAGSFWPIVLQHLLLGMNAHINLDLGIAAARTCPGDELPGLETDFDRINQVLARLVDGVKAELAEVWPHLSILDRFSGSADDAFINFSMQVARDGAWALARLLANLDEAAQRAEIAAVDRRVAALGQRIWKPGFTPASVALKIVRLGERRSTREIIDLLR